LTTKVRYADNCEFGDLNSSKSKYMMTYDHSSGEFVLKHIDTFLPGASIIPSKFVDVVEDIDDGISIENIEYGGVDGGTFI